MVGGRSLWKAMVSGIDAGVSHCQEGLRLLVLGEGRRWESLVLLQFTQLCVAPWRA